jgi:DNA sulfur modification protein DndE
MITRQIRLSIQAKDQLARVKAKTGIQNWNILCRWALCLSLAEGTCPPDLDIPADSNVEMSWEVFGGEYQQVYEALVRRQCLVDRLGDDPIVLNRYFRAHLHRGISYLSSSNFVKSTYDLLQLAAQARGGE